MQHLTDSPGFVLWFIVTAMLAVMHILTFLRRFSFYRIRKYDMKLLTYSHPDCVTFVMIKYRRSYGLYGEYGVNGSFAVSDALWSRILHFSSFCHDLEGLSLILISLWITFCRLYYSLFRGFICRHPAVLTHCRGSLPACMPPCATN